MAALVAEREEQGLDEGVVGLKCFDESRGKSTITLGALRNHGALGKSQHGLHVPIGLHDHARGGLSAPKNGGEFEKGASLQNPL